MNRCKTIYFLYFMLRRRRRRLIRFLDGFRLFVGRGRFLK
jgi:hypothetical protein